MYIRKEEKHGTIDSTGQDITCSDLFKKLHEFKVEKTAINSSFHFYYRSAPGPIFSLTIFCCQLQN